jgi:two-component system NtrC family sensor kinase
VTLRAKALLALAGMAAYAAGMFAFIEIERSRLLRDVAAIDRLREAEEQLTRAGIAVSDALFIVHRGLGANGVGLEGLPSELEELEGALKRLAGPAFGTRLAELQAAQKDLLEHPALVELHRVRAPLLAIGRDVDQEAREVKARRARLNAQVRETYQRIGALTLVLGIGGLALFGTVSMVFFTRLASQLAALRGRAGAIVQGYRGPALGSRRRDEVGELSRAIDRMAADLAEKERRLDLGLRRQMHAERMATVGAMAAKVAHEIGNPLAIISGAAQDLGASLIVEQAERIGEITRQMSRLAETGERSGSTDLNAAAATALELARFDARLALQRLVLERAPGLPAGRGDPRTVIHILMSLIFAAADESAVPVRLLTGREGDGLFVAVEPVADAARVVLAQQLAAEIGASVALDPDRPRALLRLAPEPTRGTH